MADSLLSIDVDTRALFAAMDRLPDQITAALREVAQETAERIMAEQRRRIARRAEGPTRRGQHTADTFVIEATHDGTGVIVFVKSPAMPELPLWLEFGTEKMVARPFFFAPARLEETDHDRRARAAVQDVIDEEGLGA